MISPLTKLINSCIRSGRFPFCLKLAKITPLHKKGATDDPQNYRPISILPVFSKVVEKVLCSQLLHYFERNSLFSNNQFGFRRHKSTIDAILDFVGTTLQSFESGKHSLSLFLDLSRAFDCVSHPILLEKLAMYGLDCPSVNLIKSYLNKRSQVVVVGGECSGELEVKTGVPQGSVLGPLLFLVFINDFPEYLPFASIQLFADDNTVTVAHEDLSVLEAWGAEAESRAIEWFCSNFLALNENKTERILFSLKKTPRIDRNAQVKSLGIVLDPTISWHKHIDFVAPKLSKNIFLLRYLSGFLSPNVLRTAYFALCESHMRYGIILWGNCGDALSRVFGLQRRAIRVLGSVRYRACCKAVFIREKILTFPSLFIHECLVHAHKLFNSESTTGQDIHSYNTRYKGDLRADRYRLSLSQNGPNHLSIIFFNKLPISIRCLSLKKFKVATKNLLLLHAFYTLDEFLYLKDFHI